MPRVIGAPVEAPAGHGRGGWGDSIRISNKESTSCKANHWRNHWGNKLLTIELWWGLAHLDSPVKWVSEGEHRAFGPEYQYSYDRGRKYGEIPTCTTMAYYVCWATPNAASPKEEMATQKLDNQTAKCFMALDAFSKNNNSMGIWRMTWWENN